jgi:hypothetical protein
MLQREATPREPSTSTRLRCYGYSMLACRWSGGWQTYVCPSEGRTELGERRGPTASVSVYQGERSLLRPCGHRSEHTSTSTREQKMLAGEGGQDRESNSQRASSLAGCRRCQASMAALRLNFTTVHSPQVHKSDLVITANPRRLFRLSLPPGRPPIRRGRHLLAGVRLLVGTYFTYIGPRAYRGSYPNPTFFFFNP